MGTQTFRNSVESGKVVVSSPAVSLQSRQSGKKKKHRHKEERLDNTPECPLSGLRTRAFRPIHIPLAIELLLHVSLLDKDAKQRAEGRVAEVASRQSCTEESPKLSRIWLHRKTKLVLCSGSRRD